MWIQSTQEEYYDFINDIVDVDEEFFACGIVANVNDCFENYTSANIEEAERNVATSACLASAIQSYLGMNSTSVFKMDEFSDYDENTVEASDIDCFVSAYTYASMFSNVVYNARIGVNSVGGYQKISEKFIVALANLCRNTDMKSLDNCVEEFMNDLDHNEANV